jgi:hypothetical protein
MVGNLLLRGMIAGVIAGLLVFAFARTFGEPLVDSAIAFEDQIAQARGEQPEPEIVSRQTQAGLGLFTGVMAYSVALGGLFALAFAFIHGRVSPFGARTTAALLAIAAFVAISLVPDIKYPANPPSVGDPETIGIRTKYFFVMIVLSLAAVIAAVALARNLVPKFGRWNAAIISGIAFVIVVAAVQYAMPVVNEVPENFSAVNLWRFRVTSLGRHVILWTTIGLAFGALAERRLGEARHRQNCPRLAHR